MEIKLEAEKIILREIIRRLLDYKEPRNEHINREINILEARIKEIDKTDKEMLWKIKNIISLKKKGGK